MQHSTLVNAFEGAWKQGHLTAEVCVCVCCGRKMITGRMLIYKARHPLKLLHNVPRVVGGRLCKKFSVR